MTVNAPLDRLSAALAGRYGIERELGAGGMATVYLAQDVKHDRKVAVKVLRPELAAVIGAERFLTEIKTTANLQHPHILPLFDSGEADSFLFYVMPFVDGITLRDRMSREKQLPIVEAVRIASEVASALNYAHKHGVIHRDIKPENILLHDGSALVADFGIALAASKAGTRMTETGMSLGTPQYMSPEQAMGERELDARSDVYALGCVTYEMLTGEPPFSGPTAQAIIAKVVTTEAVEASQLRKSIPAHVSDAVHTAIEKVPADRFATAAEFSQALNGGGATVSRRAVVGRTAAARRNNWMMVSATGAAALAAGVLLGTMLRSERSGITDVVRVSIKLGDSVSIRPVPSTRLAISPDGGRVAFVGNDGAEGSLWIRELSSGQSRPILSTAGATSPFFSPDGQSVGYISRASGRNELRIVNVQSGAVRTVLQDSLSQFGADWGDDNNIYFTHTNLGLARIPADGGTIAHLSRPDSSKQVTEHDYVDVLPGSRFALVMFWKGSLSANEIGVVDLESGEARTIARGSFARYVSPGYIAIGAGDGSLLAARFDVKNGTMLGQPSIMPGKVQLESTNGSVQFAVSDNGTIILQPLTDAGQELVWVDRTGKVESVDSTIRGAFSSVTLSPDDQSLAVARTDVGEGEVWIKRMPKGAFTRLSFDVQVADRPIWSLDGSYVAFLGTQGSVRKAWIQRADGSDRMKEVLPGKLELDEIRFHPDGRHLLMRTEGSSAGTRKLYIFEHGVDSVPRLLIDSRFDHYAIDLSRDGKWMTYVSEESGRPEVYVRPFPDADRARYAISVSGGTEPRWSRNSEELFYRTPRGELVAVPVTTGENFAHGVPAVLFALPEMTIANYHRTYDVSRDGSRFLMVRSSGSASSTIEVIFNWDRELDRLGKVAR